MDFVKLAREAFNSPLANRTREAIVYDFFNYALSKGEIEVGESYDDLLDNFQEIAWEHNHDIYLLIEEIGEVFGEDVSLEMDSYLFSRFENLFNNWLRVNSIDVIDGKLKEAKK